jgi:hypothetical protein
MPMGALAQKTAAQRLKRTPENRAGMTGNEKGRNRSSNQNLQHARPTSNENDA